MSKFMDLLDEYLELRDDLKDADNNFTSIQDRSEAGMYMRDLRETINDLVYSVQYRLNSLEKDIGNNR